MDIVEPCHDHEAQGVVFEVLVRGRRAQGYISCMLLEALCGGAPDNDWVTAYRRHRGEIDAAVACRAQAEGWETVLVREEDLVLQRRLLPPTPAGGSGA